MSARRSTLTNWHGAPCPRCASPLSYRADLAQPPEGWALILLACDGGHHWQERMNLKTLHSGVFVERRDDLEDPVPVEHESTLGRESLTPSDR